MAKILSQSGDSLADTYDVKGSVAGIDQLETRELPIVHEMGGTLFSERLSASIRRSTTGNINQNTEWDNVLADLPATPGRILGVCVISSDANRILNASVSVQEQAGDREMPIFLWDTNEQFLAARLVENGAAAGLFNFLANALNIGTVPSMLIGTEQPQPIDRVSFRGDTTGFGAGTVVATMLLYVAFSQVAGISSRGLPIPGW